MDQLVLQRLQEVQQTRFAAEALKIVDKRGQLVPLAVRPAQQKLQDLLDRQRVEGRPMRAIVVKSRKTGISTWVQGLVIRRCVTMPYRRAIVVAQDGNTAGALFGIGWRMWQNLPGGLRAPMAARANPAKGSKIMHFGEKVDGFIAGLDSRIQIDTAKETAAGRGETFTDMHLSECAWWQDSGKALSVITAVPDEPETLIVLESTANGYNWFHERWQRSIKGEGSFEPVFIGWTEDPDCVKPFRDEDAREDFIASIGTGPFGQEEPWLQEEFGATPEQLHFRRTAIVDKCDGKLELFKQEYPVNWAEAFIGSGRQVFSIVFTQRAVQEAEQWSKRPPTEGGPERGLFQGVEPRERKLLDGTIHVPTKAVWVPEGELTERLEWWPGQFWEARDPLWTIWRQPERTPEELRQLHDAGEITVEQMDDGIAKALKGPAQYILACDPADDIENQSPVEMDAHAFNAAVIVDHRTGEQAGELEARTDHDLFARHLFLGALFFNEAWLSVEATGGYGNSMLKLLWQRFGYRRMFERPRVDSKREQKMKDRLGWDTNRRTKPEMEAGLAEMLREGTHGIKSQRLALQLTTYVKDDRDRHGPSSGSFSDLLMAYMQAQEIRRLKPLRPPPSDGTGRANSATRPMWRY